jgi:hypothetical protein
MNRERAKKRLKEHQLLGVAELAEVLEITPQLVNNWRLRDKLPEPDYRLKSGSFWLVVTISQWLDEGQDD